MDLASLFPLTLKIRWLGVRKTCGLGLFYYNCRFLLEETGWLFFLLLQCALRNTLTRTPVKLLLLGGGKGGGKKEIEDQSPQKR